MSEQMPADEDPRTYVVTANDAGQYSIWLASRELPPGWHDMGVRGTKGECLSHIGEVWTDMRPLSPEDRETP